MLEKMWLQEEEVANHIAATVRKTDSDIGGGGGGWSQRSYSQGGRQ